MLTRHTNKLSHLSAHYYDGDTLTHTLTILPSKLLLGLCAWKALLFYFINSSDQKLQIGVVHLSWPICWPLKQFKTSNGSLSFHLAHLKKKKLARRQRKYAILAILEEISTRPPKFNKDHIFIAPLSN